MPLTMAGAKNFIPYMCRSRSQYHLKYRTNGSKTLSLRMQDENMQVHKIISLQTGSLVCEQALLFGVCPRGVHLVALKPMQNPKREQHETQTQEPACRL